MASAAKSAIGTIFQRGDQPGTSTTFTAVPEVNSIGGPNPKSGTIDVTSLDSTGGYGEYILGIIDAGEVNIEGNWTGTTVQKNVLGDLGQVARTWKILLPGTQPAAGYWTFQGVVQAFTQNFKTDAQITWSATIKITGPATFATA